MNSYLILRLTNAAIACDKRGDFALAELLTETIKELEHGDLRAETTQAAAGTRMDDTRLGAENAHSSVYDQLLRTGKEGSELLEPPGAGSQTGLLSRLLDRD